MIFRGISELISFEVGNRSFLFCVQNWFLHLNFVQVTFARIYPNINHFVFKSIFTRINYAKINFFVNALTKNSILHCTWLCLSENVLKSPNKFSILIMQPISCILSLSPTNAKLPVIVLNCSRGCSLETPIDIAANAADVAAIVENWRSLKPLYCGLQLQPRNVF
jgi:hypothetical protein